MYGTGNVELISGIFYFKIDKRTDNLILFNASNLEVKGNHHEACFGIGVEVRFQIWRRKQA